MNRNMNTANTMTDSSPRKVGAGASSVPTEHVHQVMEQTNGLDDAISESNQLVDTLAGRLMPVLREQDLQEGKGEAVPEPTAPLAALLQSHRYRVESANLQLRDLLNRLEL